MPIDRGGVLRPHDVLATREVALDTPLKFRAPGVTMPLGLGIGRLVFRALNAVELVVGCVLLVVVVWRAPGRPVVLLVGVFVMLLVQVFWLRPVLDGRAVRVIAGEGVPHSSLHLVYIAFEGVKLIALPVLGGALAWRWLT